jgi:hypothetical protein
MICPRCQSHDTYPYELDHPGEHVCMSCGHVWAEISPSRLNRRQLLTKAAVAGTLVWSVPTIIGVARADAADLNSRPPSTQPPPATSPPQPTPTTAPPQMGPPLPKGLPPELPFTGDDEHKHIVAGTAVTVAGAALWAAAKEERRYE